MKGKLQKRIFGSMLKVTGLVLAFILLLFGIIAYQSYTHRVQDDLYDQALYLSYTIDGSKTGGLDKLPLLKDRVTLLTKEGDVLYDSQVDSEKLKNHKDRPEFKEALKSGFGFEKRYSVTLNEQTLNYALQLQDGRVLRLSKTVSTLISPLIQGLVPLLITIFFLVLFVSYAAKRISRQIVDPINHIDLDHPTDLALYEEIRPLVQRISMQNRALERTLKRERERQNEFQWMVNHMSEGLLLVDHHERVMTFNNSALYLLAAHKIRRGEHYKNLRVNMSLEEDIKKGLKGQRIRRIFKRDKAAYEINIHPVEQKGQVKGVVLLVLDVTEREEMEQYRREFTANVSHELKTPLTSIMGFGELLSQGMIRCDDIKDVGSRVQSEAERLMALVQDLLKLAQLEEGGPISKKGRFSPKAVIRRVLEDLGPIAKKKDIHLIYSGESGDLLGQEKLFYEIVYNLVDNAIKYTQKPGQVEILLEENINNILLSVRDEGPGIDDDDLPRVFERFYRADKSHSSQVQGTGLGLSIVKHAVKVFEGTIDVASSSKGTTFKMEFPKN